MYYLVVFFYITQTENRKVAFEDIDILLDHK